MLSEIEKYNIQEYVFKREKHQPIVNLSTVMSDSALWCLLDDDSASAPFTVTPPGDINTLGLKMLIKAEGVNVENARDLILWKVNTDEYQ